MKVPLVSHQVSGAESPSISALDLCAQPRKGVRLLFASFLKKSHNLNGHDHRYREDHQSDAKRRSLDELPEKFARGYGRREDRHTDGRYA